MTSQRKYFVGTIIGVPARETSIFVRVSKAEKEAFQESAEKDDLSLSDWLRKLAKKRSTELGVQISKEKPSKRSA